MIASIAVQPDRARDAKAAALAPSVKLWSTVTLKRPHGAFPTGTVFKVAPGSNGAHYLVNAVVCGCHDYQQAGNICKHIRAVVASGIDLTPRCYLSDCDGTPTTWGGGACEDHTLVDAY